MCSSENVCLMCETCCDYHPFPCPARFWRDKRTNKLSPPASSSNSAHRQRISTETTQSPVPPCSLPNHQQTTLTRWPHFEVQMRALCKAQSEHKRASRATRQGHTVSSFILPRKHLPVSSPPFAMKGMSSHSSCKHTLIHLTHPALASGRLPIGRDLQRGILLATLTLVAEA